MNKQLFHPSKEDLEELLREVKPNPSQRFYNRMKDTPWNRSWRFVLRERLEHPRLVIGFILILVLGMVLILTTPPLNTLASRIAQFFISASSDMMVIEMPILEYSDSGQFPFTTIAGAARQADFKVKTPTKLPDVYEFIGAVYHPVRQSVTFNYKARDGSILRITQRSDGTEYQSISVNAKVEKVQIGEVVGEYVSGGWRANQPLEQPTNLTVTVQATWDLDANIHFLRWQEEDILFEILFIGSNLDSPDTLNKMDLITIATNLK